MGGDEKESLVFLAPTTWNCLQKKIKELGIPDWNQSCKLLVNESFTNCFGFYVVIRWHNFCYSFFWKYFKSRWKAVNFTLCGPITSNSSWLFRLMSFVQHLNNEYIDKLCWRNQLVIYSVMYSVVLSVFVFSAPMAVAGSHKRRPIQSRLTFKSCWLCIQSQRHFNLDSSHFNV